MNLNVYCLVSGSPKWKPLPCFGEKKQSHLNADRVRKGKLHAYYLRSLGDLGEKGCKPQTL